MLARRSSNVSAPYVFPPSGSFGGSDGSWSTFFVNLGDSGQVDKGQDFEVLISTAASAVIVPLEADWCTVPDPDACAESRGVEIYNAKQSRGFQDNSTAGYQPIGLYTLSLETNLDHGPDPEPNAVYGYTTVGLGALSDITPQLLSQVVAGITTQNFPMGYFGLSTTPVKLTNAQYSTFLTNFKDNIPSLSYGYTAGAQYRNNGVFANLVLGGFDRSLITGKSTSISMPGQGNNTLIVGVQSILVNPASNNDVYSLTDQGFFAQIDSTLPYLWLPDSVCDEFERVFGLTYDWDTKLYTLNESSHTRNLETNASVTFNIGKSEGSDNDFTSIILPYGAFDLEASFPIYATPTRYFPVKRSPTNNFVLGRTFLQETYLIVDYERDNFTVAPAFFSDPMPSPDVVPIYSTSFDPTTREPSGSKLSTGSIIGIVVAICVVVLAASIAGFMWHRRRKQRSAVEEPAAEATDPKLGHLSDTSELAGQTSFLTDTLPHYGFYSGHKVAEPLQPLAELESPNQTLELESPPLAIDGASSPEFPVPPQPPESTETHQLTPTQIPLPDEGQNDEALQLDEVLLTPVDDAVNEGFTTRNAVSDGDVTSAKSGSEVVSEIEANEESNSR